MGEEDFFENLYKNSERVDYAEIPLNVLLETALELGERRGRMFAMRDYTKVNGENSDVRDLLAISGIRLEEEMNAQM